MLQVLAVKIIFETDVHAFDFSIFMAFFICHSKLRFDNPVLLNLMVLVRMLWEFDIINLITNHCIWNPEFSVPYHSIMVWNAKHCESDWAKFYPSDVLPSLYIKLNRPRTGTAWNSTAWCTLYKRRIFRCKCVYSQ